MYFFRSALLSYCKAELWLTGGGRGGRQGLGGIQQQLKVGRGKTSDNAPTYHISHCFILPT